MFILIVNSLWRNVAGAWLIYLSCLIVILYICQMEQVSIMQYIKRFNLDITRQGVLWRINHGLSLPYVISYKMIGRGWVLTVGE